LSLSLTYIHKLYQHFNTVLRLSAKFALFPRNLLEISFILSTNLHLHLLYNKSVFKTSTSWEDSLSLIYHSKQWMETKQSTYAFVKFIKPKVMAGKKVLDIGCGTGAALYYIAKTFPNTQFNGIDKSKNLILLANQKLAKLEIANLKFNQGNLFRLKKLKQIDGVVSLQTISWVKELRKPMTQIFKKINPNWICMSGLFYEGDISCKTLVYDHSLEREVYYNTYSLKELNRISNFYGYKLTKVKPFKIDIDISEPKNKDHMSTFTIQIADSSDRLQISGPILLNWYFVMIEKSNNS